MESKAVENFQFYPTGVEFLILTAVFVQLLIAGYLLRAIIMEKHKFMPIKFALPMLLVAIGVLAYQTYLIKQASRPDHVLTALFWCFAYSIIPMFFFIKNFVDALSDQGTNRIDTMGTKISDLSEFNAARKLAQKGDIDGAVQLYRGYRENRSGALLEAARLLRTEERYADSVTMYQEIINRFVENRLVWAEATYSLAKIMETNLNQPITAMQYFAELKRRVPESKQARMAESDLSRLQVMTGKKIGELNEPTDEMKNENPDIPKIQVPMPYDRENIAQDLLDAPIPDRDPFMSRDIYTVRGAKPEVKTAPIHRAVVKKALAKKKGVAKKASTAAKTQTSTPLVKVSAKPNAKKKAAVVRKASVSGLTASGSGAKPKAKAAAKPKAKTAATVKAKPKAAPKKKPLK